MADAQETDGKPRKPRAVAPPKFEEYWKLRMDGATMRLRAAQQIVSHTGTRGNLAENETFKKHVTAWAGKAGSPGRELWPERVFNMGQKFLVLPDPAYVGDPAKRPFVVAAEKDPVVQLFLTVVLAEAGVDKVRAFFMTEDTGDELLSF